MRSHFSGHLHNGIEMSSCCSSQLVVTAREVALLIYYIVRNPQGANRCQLELCSMSRWWGLNTGCASWRDSLFLTWGYASESPGVLLKKCRCLEILSQLSLQWGLACKLKSSTGDYICLSVSIEDWFQKYHPQPCGYQNLQMVSPLI